MAVNTPDPGLVSLRSPTISTVVKSTPPRRTINVTSPEYSPAILFARSSSSSVTVTGPLVLIELGAVVTVPFVPPATVMNPEEITELPPEASRGSVYSILSTSVGLTPNAPFSDVGVTPGEDASENIVGIVKAKVLLLVLISVSVSDVVVFLTTTLTPESPGKRVPENISVSER